MRIIYVMKKCDKKMNKKQFKEVNVVQKKCKSVENESFLVSIDESSTDNESDERSIRLNNIEYIWVKTMYIQTLTQYNIDLKYVTILCKHR